MRKRGRQRQKDLTDDQELTEYGSKRNPRPPDGAFKCRPVSGGDDDVSMILGRVAIEEAKRLVSMPVVVAGDGVRYTIVGALRKAGFVVEHTPNQGNAKHVSVRTAGEVWGDDHAARFAQCFTEEPVFAEAGARHGR